MLLGPAEMEGEYAGEDLRKEVCLKILKNSERATYMNSFFVKLLETMDERPPPRPLTDDLVQKC